MIYTYIDQFKTNTKLKNITIKILQNDIGPYYIYIIPEEESRVIREEEAKEAAEEEKQRILAQQELEKQQVIWEKEEAERNAKREKEEAKRKATWEKEEDERKANREARITRGEEKRSSWEDEDYGPQGGGYYNKAKKYY